MEKQALTVNLSAREVGDALAKLLSQFADPDAPALKTQPLKNLVVGDTGVMVELDHKQQHNLIGVAFFLTIHKGTPEELTKLAAITFDIDQLVKNHEEYVRGMIFQILIAIDDITEKDAYFNRVFAADFDGKGLLHYVVKH